MTLKGKCGNAFKATVGETSRREPVGLIDNVIGDVECLIQTLYDVVCNSATFLFRINVNAFASFSFYYERVGKLHPNYRKHTFSGGLLFQYVSTKNYPQQLWGITVSRVIQVLFFGRTHEIQFNSLVLGLGYVQKSQRQ